MAEPKTQKQLPNSQDLLSGILAGFDTSPAQKGAPTPTTSGELDTWLNDWQTRSAQSIRQDDDAQIFEGGALDDLTQQLSPGELEKPPSLTDEMARMRGDYDLDTLEQELNELKRMEREQQAVRRERMQGTFQERTRASAVQGQIGEIERQESMRIDAINREIAYQTDQINTAYNAIDTTMQVMQMDWQMSKEWWQTQFNANMTVYQQLRSEFESDRSFEEQKRQFEIDQAKSNLQVYAGMITSGQLTYDTMDSALKTEITKLEIKSGLGKGFLSKIQMDPNDKIKSITTREHGGWQYSDIQKYNPGTKKMETETIRLGRVDVAPVGGAGGAGVTQDAAQQEQELERSFDGWREETAYHLSSKSGADGNVSPSTWNAAVNQAQGIGVSAYDFYRNFAHYVNHSHGGDYQGVPAPTWGTKGVKAERHMPDSFRPY